MCDATHIGKATELSTQSAMSVPLIVQKISDYASAEQFFMITIASCLSLTIITIAASGDDPGLRLHSFTLHMISGSGFVTIPMLLELCMDRKLHQTVTLPRLLLLVAFPVTSILILVGNFYWSSLGMFMRELCLRNSLMCNMFQDRREFTPFRKVCYLAVLIIFCVDINLRLEIVFRTYVSNLVSKPMLMGMSAMFMLTLLGFSVLVFRIYRGTITTPGAVRGGEKYCVYYSILLVLSLLVKMFVRIAAEKSETTKSDRYNTIATVYCFIDIVLCVLAAIIPSRIARNDFDMAQVGYRYMSSVHMCMWMGREGEGFIRSTSFAHVPAE